MALDDIQRRTQESLQSSTSEIWDFVLRSEDPKLQDVLGEILIRLENATLVDMGSGKDDSIARMFVHAGVEKYVGVDRIHHAPTRVLPFASFRKAEMGDFVGSHKVLAELKHGKRYPSTNFMFNAINGPLIDESKMTELLSILPHYMQEGDYIFGVVSDIPEFLLKEPFTKFFQPRYFNPEKSPFFAFRLHFPPEVGDKQANA